MVYVNCTLSSNTAYSSTASGVTFASGSYLIFDQVTTSARALYMGSVTAASDLRIEVISVDSTVPLSVHLAVYPGSCVTTTSNSSIDGCPSGATCSIGHSSDGTNCLLTYTQVAGSSADSNSALYGLFGLAVIPVVVLLALAFKVTKSTKPAEVSAPMDYFAYDYTPQQQQWNTPVAGLDYFGSATPEEVFGYVPAEEMVTGYVPAEEMMTGPGEQAFLVPQYY